MIPADQFRTKSKEKKELIQSFDSLSEEEKANRLAAIWEVDSSLEKLIAIQLGDERELSEEMKRWMPFKGISPFSEWQKLRKSGKEVSYGELLKLANEVEDKQISIEGLNIETFGENE